MSRVETGLDFLRMLHWIDILIILVYICCTIAIGILCRGRQQNTEDYFTASGGMKSVFQSLLVGLSIAATLFSGISFLAYPSVVYSNGIGILLGVNGFILSWFVLRFWFLKRYLTGDAQHPYEIIEKTLGASARTMTAGLYVLLRVGWMAALIYAPTIAIMSAFGLGGHWFWPIVMIIGLSSTFYTTLGGIRGVVVTDAIQFVIIAVGLATTVGIVIARLPATFGQVIELLGQKGHFQLFDFSMDPTKLITVWTMLIAFNISNFSTYMADQMSLQRYLAAGDIKAASRSFLTNIIGVIIVSALLVVVGLSLTVWYHFTPDSGLPAEPDRVFPYFIATQLPVGCAGLVLAAIMAATMSSMTSGINTLSATLTLDFRGRFGKPLAHEKQLKFAKMCSLIIGVSSTVVAGFVGKLGTIFEMTQAILGLFLGPILTCMFFAIINYRVKFFCLATGVLSGFVAGAFVMFSAVANVWAAAVGFFVSLTFVYVISLFMKNTENVK